MLRKTFWSHVKLCRHYNFQVIEHQINKKFYVKLLPLVDTFIYRIFAPNSG